MNDKPSFQEVADTYKTAKRISIIGATVLTLLLIIVWPCITIPFKAFSLNQFEHWVGYKGIVE